MKKVVSVIFLALALLTICVVSNPAHSQDTTKVIRNTAPVKDTVIRGVKYPIYVGAKGGRYIIRTSAKTNKEYKQYLKKQ